MRSPVAPGNDLADDPNAPPFSVRGARDLAAVPSIGRANHVEGATAPEADVTRALYEQYANQIFRYCLHQLGSREEAEDAVQSTFLNAFRGMRRGVVPELESAWLFKIAHNVCLSRHRSAWRRGRIESPADFDVVEELAPAPSRRADELIGLQDVLEQMPETQRRAILLREWQGLSYREIAAELELSQTAVETLIFRARRSLAAGLEEPPSRRRRIARAADVGNVAAALKSLLLGGGVAAKLAVTAALVGGAAAVVAAAPQHRHHATPPAPASATRVAPAAAVSDPHPAAVAGAKRRVTPPTSAAPAAHARNAARRAAHARTHALAQATPAGNAYGRVGQTPVQAAKAMPPTSQKPAHTRAGAKAARPAHVPQVVRGPRSTTAKPATPAKVTHAKAAHAKAPAVHGAPKHQKP